MKNYWVKEEIIKPDFSRLKLTFEKFELTEEEAIAACKAARHFVYPQNFEPIPFAEGDKK